MLAVVGDGAGFSTSVLAIEPRDEETWMAAGAKLREGGWQRISRRDWSRCVAAVVPYGAVDVVKHKVVRVAVNSTASIFAAAEVQTTPMWTSAARERRALVALTPPGAFPQEQYSPDEVGDVLYDVAGSRALLAALVPVRFDVFTGRVPGR